MYHYDTISNVLIQQSNDNLLSLGSQVVLHISNIKLYHIRIQSKPRYVGMHTRIYWIIELDY